MVTRKLMAAVGLATALALPVVPALAAHNGDGHGGHAHGQGRLHDGRVEAHNTHNKGQHGWGRFRLQQFEGIVASYDGASLVLHPLRSEAVTVTVTISSSTVITADEGVTTTTLAQGEQVHVKAALGADGSYTAVRVTIQRAEGQTEATPEDNSAAQPTTTPEDNATAQPTAEPTTTPDQESQPETPHKHKKHGGDSSLRP